MNTDFCKKQIMLHGHVKHDMNMNRDIKEIIGYQYTISRVQIIELLATRVLLSKYSPELSDFQQWYEDNFPLYYKPEHRRRIVYFNDHDYKNVHQCISLIQVIDNIMIVYQRSSDTDKLLDDLRFFCEIIERYFPTIQEVLINYGSFHTQI